jgi:hypothetical protein
MGSHRSFAFAGLALIAVITGTLVFRAAKHDAGSEQWATIERYCFDCHNELDRAGDQAFDSMSAESIPHDAAVWEDAVRKLRSGLMPPAGAPRPENSTVVDLVDWLTAEIDAGADAGYSGRVALRRLNRREYQNAVRDLIGLNIDATALLPEDNIEGYFDNNADALQVSPAFVDQYINAARSVAQEAIGNPDAPPVPTTYGDPANMIISLPPAGAPGTGRQQHHIAGMPFGTRGGFAIEHTFPADGEYELTIGDMALAREAPRIEFENTVIVLLDRVEIYRTTIGGEADHKAIDQLLDPAVEEINNRLRNIRFNATAGQHELAVTFLHRGFAESDERTRTIALEGGQERIQAAHALEIRGPLNVTGISDTGARAQIFSCRPRDNSEERTCATQIVTQLAERAFRRPVIEADIVALMAFYDSGAANGGFDAGIRDALSAILASPHFIYRAETAVADNGGQLSDLALASRLSFFLWSSLPDQALLDLAEENRLGEPQILREQVARMLADDRARSLITDFSFQWLDVAKLDEIVPDRGQFPHASNLLDPRELLKEELNRFVDSILRSDRSVLELLTADHTYLNERLAMHYGIETVKGARFREVTLSDPQRHGLLGKGAVLMLTAYPNRTSPVLRGAWILERLMGAPPPEPPPDVPELAANEQGQPPRTLRERLEQHRENPNCFSCHGIMDPLGMALENFNAVGQYRTHDRETRTLIDSSGVLPDGSTVADAADLRASLTARPQWFVQAFTESLFSYALGRSIDYRDMPQVRAIVESAEDDNYRFEAIVNSIVSSNAFRQRTPQDVTIAATQ